MELKEDEDDSDDEDYADNEGDEDEEEEEDGHADLITERLIKMNYTMLDIVMMFTGRTTKKNDTKYTDEYLMQVVRDFDTVSEEIDNEEREKLQFEQEDKPAPVLAN
jgi:bisphosphoglycerate-dependent phosphoglycerate mutase